MRLSVHRVIKQLTLVQDSSMEQKPELFLWQKYKQKLEMPNLYQVFCCFNMHTTIKAQFRKLVSVVNNVLNAFSSSMLNCPLRNFSI